MKRQICITLDEVTHHNIQKRLLGAKYRSKSHFIECAVEQFLKEAEK
ncbi:hypothetical protein HYY69_02265 [Candidatus Woesearchaeota archaeon]|nr:hypothetical protein [Candidatus Woesearchaeota archaeon]